MDYMNCPCRNCITLVICRNLDEKTTIKRKCPLLFDYLYEDKGGGHIDLYEDNVLRCITVYRILKQDFWRIGIKETKKALDILKKKRRGIKCRMKNC